jgi:sugar lactone lactonase YvrE
MRSRSYFLILASLVFSLAGCGGDPPVTIGGTIIGVTGSGLVLTNNGSDDLAVTANGTFAFATPLARGASYAVAVKAQPANPAQTCTISGGSGTAGNADVTTISVTCETRRFHLGGTISGLLGTGLVLQNSGGDNLSISADGAFTFAAPVASGTAYAVTVLAAPSSPTQACTITNGTGTINDADVTNVTIACVTSKFTIGGTVTGLAGAGLVLQNNGGDDLSITADGTFTFATAIDSGASYTVTALSQPSGPTQTCTVAGGTGTVGAGNVTSVAVNCTTNRYTISGTISGLAASATLQNNGGDDLIVTANGTFAFATPIASGATYDVTVLLQPTSPWQTCTVSPATGMGTVTNADVTSVVVTCTTNTYTIGGMLSGLASGESVVLRNNGTNNLTLNANGSFTFTAPVSSGQPYAVTVLTNPMSPISQTCAVTNGAGMVAGMNITDVVVACTTNSFTVSAAVTGMTGTGMVLQNNGAGNLTINANGTYAFATSVASGATYNVTIATQPSGVICTIPSPSGTIGASNVTVAVSCGTNWSTSLFPIVVPGSNFGLGDLAFDGNGDLLVTVTSPARSIVRVNRTTGAQTTIATGIGTSTYLLGIAYRAANDMIYTHNDGGQIYSVTSAGVTTLLTTYTGVGLNAIAIAPSTFGAYAGFIIGGTNSGAVIAINPADGVITTIATTTAISDLAFAPDGTLYVTGTSSVRTVTSVGVVTSFLTGLSAAEGITISPDGSRMFLAQAGNNTVVQATIPGGVVTTIGSYDIDDGYFVGGILADSGNTVIVMTGETSLTLRAFTY